MPRGGARRGAGRPAGTYQTWSPEQVQRFRDRIQTFKILERLNKVALGLIEPKKGEMSAALGLLDKVLPSLAASQSTVTHRHAPAEMTDEQIAERLGQLGGAGTPADAAEAPADKAKLN